MMTLQHWALDSHPPDQHLHLQFFLSAASYNFRVRNVLGEGIFNSLSTDGAAQGAYRTGARQSENQTVLRFQALEAV